MTLNGAVLVATQGQYSDRSTWVVAAFADVELANAHKAELDAELKRVTEAIRVHTGGDIGYGIRLTPDRSDVCDRYAPVKGAHSAPLGIPTSLGALGINRDLVFVDEVTTFVVEMPIRGLT